MTQYKRPTVDVNGGPMEIKEADMKVRELIDRNEQCLTRWFGKKRSSISPAIRWLFGGIIINMHMTLFDHPEYRIKDGKRTVIIRPYGITSIDDLKEIIALAERKRLKVQVLAETNYNTSTIVVALTEKD